MIDLVDADPDIFHGSKYTSLGGDSMEITSSNSNAVAMLPTLKNVSARSSYPGNTRSKLENAFVLDNTAKQLTQQ